MTLDEFWAAHRGAVSLTFDDGTPNQLETAIPAMDKVGIKGSFYVAPRGPRWETIKEAWKEAAAAGHEIGNHTMSHICSSNFGRSGVLEDKTLADLEADILAAQERLAEIAPHQKDWTFAYPCYMTHVGRGVGRQSYVPVVAKHFLAGRCGGEYGFANHPAHVDLAAFWGSDTTRMGGPELIGLVEDLTAQGRWVALVFHGIDAGRLSVPLHDFEKLLAYLARNADKIWTAPAVEVARRIAAYQAETAAAG